MCLQRNEIIYLFWKKNIFDQLSDNRDIFDQIIDDRDIFKTNY